jgi:hypothetical protein
MPPSQLEIIEYEALKILFRSQQYAKFCELADGFLPHMVSPWRHTMVLDWYLHCASCWGAGDLQKTVEVGEFSKTSRATGTGGESSISSSTQSSVQGKGRSVSVFARKAAPGG